MSTIFEDVGALGMVLFFVGFWNNTAGEGSEGDWRVYYFAGLRQGQVKVRSPQRNTAFIL